MDEIFRKFCDRGNFCYLTDFCILHYSVLARALCLCSRRPAVEMK